MVTDLCKPNGHPNVVAVFRHGEFKISNLYFFDMELCAQNLEMYMKDHGPSTGSRMTTLQICTVIEHISGGVAFIHSKGKVHRDLKPRNGNFLNLKPGGNDSTLLC